VTDGGSHDAKAREVMKQIVNTAGVERVIGGASAPMHTELVTPWLMPSR
jgi:hypothetical protein